MASLQNFCGNSEKLLPDFPRNFVSNALHFAKIKKKIHRERELGITLQAIESCFEF